MSDTSSSPESGRCCQKFASCVGIVGAFLVVGILVYVMKHSTPTTGLNTARVQERKTALAEIRDSSAKALVTYDWQDQAKGIVRLPIERAKELTIAEYKDPAAARKVLNALAEKANAKLPEAPSKYE